MTNITQCLGQLGVADEAIDALSQADVQALEEGPVGQLLLALAPAPSVVAQAANTDGPGGLLRAQRSLLEAQQQIAELKAEAAQLGGRAALCTAYCGRLEQLQRVMQQYGQSLTEPLARLGFGGDAAAAGDTAAATEYLQSMESTLRRVLHAGPSDAAELLQLCTSACSAPLPAATVLQLVQVGLEEDIAAVQQGRQQACAAEAGPALEGLLDTLRERHWQGFSEAEHARQQAQELAQRLQQAHNAEARVERPEGGPSDARLALLAAQQAGLRAAVQELERLNQGLKAQQQSAAAQQEEAAAALATLEQLERQEEELDATLRLLCAANSMLAQQWREGTWAAQGFIADSILAAQQPLRQLGAQLVEAMQSELEAFQGMPWPAVAAGKGGSDQAASSIREAAVRLDPVAHLKTAEHCAAVLSAAAEELEALRPVHSDWEALVAGASERLEGLQATAAELERGVAELNTTRAEGIHKQLDQACSAAEEGQAAVKAVREALTDWWTLPALKAAPWMMHEGKTAAEWLQVLSEQQERLYQRDVLRDHSNRAAMMKQRGQM